VKKLVFNSYAKLNLYLAVLDKRKDSYHNLLTIFERISLHDKIILKPLAGRKIKISCTSPEVPEGSSNLAYKAAQLLQDSLKLNKGVEIKIIKRIPVGSGMGGGSSNAAAVLLGLNQLWKLNLKRRELIVYAKALGADVPFFIYDTPFALGQERGDKITPLSGLKKKKFWQILVVPRIKVSTPLIFKKWDQARGGESGKIEALTMEKDNDKILTLALRTGNLSLISKTLFNSLEQITAKLYPEITCIRKKFVQAGLESILMSGSGPTVFGFVSSGKEAQSLCRQLERNRFWQVFVTRTV